jgi:hypothetical protein
MLLSTGSTGLRFHVNIKNISNKYMCDDGRVSSEGAVYSFHNGNANFVKRMRAALRESGGTACLIPYLTFCIYIGVTDYWGSKIFSNTHSRFLTYVYIWHIYLALVDLLNIQADFSKTCSYRVSR